MAKFLELQTQRLGCRAFCAAEVVIDMEAKSDAKLEFKSGDKKAGHKDSGEAFVDESLFSDEKTSEGKVRDEDASWVPPRVDVLELKVEPSDLVEIDAGVSLDIRFDVDRDIIAGYWVVQFLVDSCKSRIIRILGETSADDYTEGENEMHFEVPRINVDGIEPSALTNAGLLMAKLMANGEEVISVNMVVQVFVKNGKIIREILSPIE